MKASRGGLRASGQLCNKRCHSTTQNIFLKHQKVTNSKQLAVDEEFATPTPKATWVRKKKQTHHSGTRLPLTLIFYTNAEQQFSNAPLKDRLLPWPRRCSAGIWGGVQCPRDVPFIQGFHHNISPSSIALLVQTPLTINPAVEFWEFAQFAHTRNVFLPWLCSLRTRCPEIEG